MTIPLPSRTTTEQGRPRRLGVEIEFAGLAPASILEVLDAELGGTVHRVTRFEYRLTGTAVGDLELELDAAYMKDLARAAKEAESRRELERVTDDVLAEAAQVVVPWEIITEPQMANPLHRYVRRRVHQPDS